MSVQEQVDIVARADTAQAQQFWKIFAEGAYGAERAVGRLQPTVDGASQSAAQWLGRLTAQVLGVSNALQVVQRVAALIRAEYENFLQKNQRAAETQIDFAVAEREYAGQLPPGTDLNAIRPRVLDISRRTGVNAGVAGRAYARILSTRGATLTPEQSLQALEQAAIFRPGPQTDVDTLNWTGQAISMLQRGMELSPEQAMGFILQQERINRSQDIEALTRYGIPGIMQGMSFGRNKDRPEYVGSMLAAIGIRSEDPYGRRSRTGLINMLRQLRVASAGAGLPNDTSIEAMMNWFENDPRGQAESDRLLGPLQNGKIPQDPTDPNAEAAVRRAFGPKVDFTAEAPTFVALMELIQRGDNETKRLFRASLAQSSDPRGAANLAGLTQMRQQLAQSAVQQVSKIDSRLFGETQSLQISDTGAGMTGAIRKRLPELLQARGDWALQQRVKTFGFDIATMFGADPAETAEGLAGRTLRSIPARDQAAIEQVYGKTIEQQTKVLEQINEKLGRPQEIRIQDGEGNAARGQMQGQAQGAGR